MAWNIRSYFKEESMAKIISFAEKGKKAEPEAKVIALDLAIKEASKAIIRIKEMKRDDPEDTKLFQGCMSILYIAKFVNFYLDLMNK